jgi:hypothetical protein
MRRKFRIISLSVFAACAAEAAVASPSSISYPSYIDAEREIHLVSTELQDPRLGLGTKYDEMSAADRRDYDNFTSYRRWGLRIRIAEHDLLGGQVAKFQEHFAQAVEGIDATNPDYAVKIAPLLHLAVEADVARPTTSSTYDQVAAGIDAAFGRSMISRDERTLWMASIQYASANFEALRRLAADQPRETTDAAFVSGYAQLLLAKSSGDPSDAAMASQTLNAVLKALEREDRVAEAGRVSLLLAECYQLLATAEPQHAIRAELIDSAVAHAKMARQTIEIIDYPLLWGAALRVTSEVLDMLYETKQDPTERGRLALQRDRAYELSMEYR